MIRQVIAITILTTFSLASSTAMAQYYRDSVNPRRNFDRFLPRLPGEKRLSDASLEIPTSNINAKQFFQSRSRDHSMFLNPDFGVLAGITRPNDLVGYSIRRNSLIRLKSKYLNELVKLPVDQFPSANPVESPWTLEEVEAALAQRSTARTALDSQDWRFSQRDDRDRANVARAAELRLEGLSLFRDALRDDVKTRLDNSDKLRLFARASRKFESARELNPDDPSNYIALTIVEREKRNLNTALVNLMQGLSRLDSLSDLQFRREDFFEDERDWGRRLDDVNVLANSTNHSEAYLMLSLFAHLNGDRSLAKTSAEEALKRYIKKVELSSLSTYESAEYEKRIEQTQLFIDMLDSHTEAMDKAKADETQNQLGSVFQ